MGETTNLKNVLLISVFLVAATCSIAAGRTIYVDDSAAVGGNGESWARAYKYLQNAIAVAYYGDKIIVAQGIYRPDEDSAHPSGTGDRKATFQLKTGVALKGGYAGLDEPEPGARNYVLYETVLSGDLNGDDGPDFTNNSENSYHVVTGSWTNATAILEGFTITSGNANDGTSMPEDDCSGGGLWNNSGSPIVRNCTFNKNSAMYGGGLGQGHDGLVLINCIFSGNLGWRGGGMYTYESHAILRNCLFTGNSATNDGGGIINHFQSPKLFNCTLTGNTAAKRGGGIYDYMTGSTLTNCIFWGNSDRDGVGESSQFRHYEGGPYVVNYCCVQGWTGTLGGVGNIGDDPLLGPDDCHLQANSPCIDAGDNSAVPSEVIIDLDGNPRFIDDPDVSDTGHGIPPIVDMGAYEGTYQDLLLSTQSIIVSEGETETFTVQLLEDPLEPIEVTVTVESGDPDITVESGGLLIFDSTNYSQPQTVTLAAAEDVDELHGSTLILVSAPGIYPASVTAYELDSEGPTVLYVDCDARGSFDGSSWENAFTDLREGLSFVAGTFWIKEIRVAQGAYSPEGPLPDVRQASNPNPANGARRVTITADLSWTAGLDATSHDVYFGMSSPGVFQGNHSDTTFDPGTMAHSTTYFWRIDEVNKEGKTTTGIVWSFRTIGPGPSSPPPLGDSNVQDTEVSTAPRTGTFQLKNGIAIRGGYAGFGQPDPNARDIDAYHTILSGDIGIRGDSSDNSFHVVTGSGCNETAVLDGFTITAGNANGPWWEYHVRGAGMYNNEGSPTLTNCTFKGNCAEGVGGGMYNRDSSPKLKNCTFSGNSAEFGGGMDNREESSPLLTNCIFRNNSSTSLWVSYGGGGGMANSHSDAVVANCTFSGNSATQSRGGGIYNWESTTTITNCVFVGNYAELGGGMLMEAGSFAPDGPPFTERLCKVILNNCTFAGNSALDGSALACTSPEELFSSNVQLTNCILWDDSDEIQNNDDSVISITYSDVLGGWPGEGNIDTDPCFVELGYWVLRDDLNIVVEPNDPNAIWVEGDYHLLLESPCINAGDPNYIAAPNETDLDGLSRVIGGRIDIGAYEFQNAPPVANAGLDQIVECACNTAEGTKVTLEGTGSYDADGDPLTYTWTGPFVESPVYGATPIVTLEGGCPGEYVITLVVNDGIDESGPNDVMITVVDTTPPEFEFSVAPTMLWPPDHKMVEITPSWTVSDECDATPDVSLVGIVANEGDDTIGDGHTSNDIQIGEDGSIYLRSERSGTSSDRVYTITYQAVDDSGNTTVCSATVSIPHDFKVLARIAARWLWAGSGRIPEDLNGDGVVNLKDIAIFANNWIQ